MKKDFDLNKCTGYELVMKETIKEINSEAYYLRHIKSGARVMLMLNDDNNKVFNIAFRTPVDNSTGVPHILEHSVLCGSKKYSAKDPFVELVKGSLNTFLNAMTYPDKTMYPIASCNDKDYENLMDVYMDAVLNPNIYVRDEIFRQEGWNYHIESKEDDITINGVVYNEMKGALASPEAAVSSGVYENLFPENTYQYESGGEPACIPDLSYEEFLDFHKKYYHPSNSYIFLYGDIDGNERLEWLDKEYLSSYEKMDIDSEIPVHGPFSSPKECENVYGVGKNEDIKNKAYFTYATVADSVLEKDLYTALSILDYTILSMPGAPLKKALIDSGICEDVDGGVENTCQNVFLITAKNVDESRKNEFVRIVEDTLKVLVKNGIDKNSLRAALNRKEFNFREADYGSYPKGLYYCIDMMDTWLYKDDEPFMLLKMDETFDNLRAKIDTDYYEKLIEKYILNNNHKVILTTMPKQGLAEEKEETLAKKMKAYKDSLSEEEIEKLVNDTKELLEYQSTPSTKEELMAIPLLKLEDIAKEPEKIYMEEKEIDGVKVIYSDVFTNKIAYLRCSFDTANLSKEMLPYVPFISRIIKNIDTKNYEYLELNNKINLETGGIFVTSNIYSKAEVEDDYSLRMEVVAKVLYDNVDKAFELCSELVNNTVFESEKRIKEIISEIKLSLQSSITNSGHTSAVNRIMSYFSKDGYVNDLTAGIGYYKFIRQLEKDFDNKKEEIISNIKNVAKAIFNVNNLIMSVTAEPEGYKIVEDNFHIFKDSLENSPVEKVEWEYTPDNLNEGFATPSQVQYVARAGNFKDAGYKYTGSMIAFSNIMNYEYLWNNIRVKGGAYGCFARCARTGKMYFASYRDPNLANTNDVYKSVPEYLRTFNVDERDLLKFIIGTISSLDTPRTAKTKGLVAFNSYMSDVTYEDMVRERQEVLSLTNEDVNALADIVEAVLSQDNICVIGSESKIDSDKELFKTVEDLFD